MKSDAYVMYRAIWDLRERKITPDGYRAIMRDCRERMGDALYEQTRVRVIAADIRNCERS